MAAEILWSCFAAAHSRVYNVRLSEEKWCTRRNTWYFLFALVCAHTGDKEEIKKRITRITSFRERTLQTNCRSNRLVSFPQKCSLSLIYCSILHRLKLYVMESCKMMLNRLTNHFSTCSLFCRSASRRRFTVELEDVRGQRPGKLNPEIDSWSSDRVAAQLPFAASRDWYTFVLITQDSEDHLLRSVLGVHGYKR